MTLFTRLNYKRRTSLIDFVYKVDLGRYINVDCYIRAQDRSHVDTVDEVDYLIEDRITYSTLLMWLFATRKTAVIRSIAC